MGEHALAALAVHRARQWIDEEMGDFASMLRVSSLKDAELLIHCEHSMAMQECNGKIPLLLAFLKDNCPEVVISSIRLIRL